MKSLISILAFITALIFTPLSTAEIWKDYGLSEEVTELTVVSVKTQLRRRIFDSP